ncbi:MAG: MFS transporter [Actinomycetaceae bacterium]
MTLRSALAFFADRNVRLWCLVAMPAYTIGFTIAYNLVRPILVDAGWAEARIGLVVVIGGSGVGIVAGIAAGMAIARLGRRRALVRLGVLQVLATLATVPIALGATGLWVVLLVVAVANGAFAASAAVVFTLSMDLTRPESAGTDFTFFSTVSGIAMVASAALGLAAADAFGFGPVVAGAAVLAALGLILAVRTVDRIDVEPRQEVAVPVVASS